MTSLDIARELLNPNYEITKLPNRITRRSKSHNGSLEIIENAGGKLLADTCMVVAPLEEMELKYIATNSAKTATYLRSH